MEPKVRAPLSEQGFDVLTDIDVAPTLRAKLGVERAPYPTFAQRALELGPSVVLLPPCNVVLETVDAGTRVAIVDPRALVHARSSRRSPKKPPAHSRLPSQ